MIAGGSRCSATWPSSAPSAPAYHRGDRRARAASSAIERVIAVGELARDYGGTWVATAPRLRSDSAPSCGPATSCSSKAPLGGTRGRRGELDRVMSRVLVAALVAMIIAILSGPTFIDFLRRNEVGQHIREEGLEHHFRSRAHRRWAVC